ncbi:SMI1/KNR4 family protein [Streptomyces somaliensis DSM 40738]|uniref:SMI1/KNR4 family protein n=1 Tax=Streptomyces somaliensis (strain ATCC 33201 / DSM 40738 / JCM 12659 / KCTC 9044 / NCTC 11332 / NRRL B-12077 / IP 733) TaxID=1134445 RepID=A0AA44DBQ6_STRE0|nr:MULTISPECIES: SMI1/KNR4 family protein [Streptomyces]MCQ0024044.1 SMI1/KNR4 family protein [Streptomyces somaliensis DSM 40738]NKY13921.1 SMI1/KNR4 family protein [Streptomyces somaliensis DSM 40738]URM89948.1 SMI1/KNR4 family protein [Streptomyces sp. MRC013]
MSEQDQVEVAFDRVGAWLRKHAPMSYQALGAPASEAEIAATEAGMHVAFPGELRALLGLHNGTEWCEVEGDEEGELNPAAFLPHGALYSLEQMRQAHTLYANPGPGIGDAALRTRVPWAGDDDGFYGLYVDTEGGQVGRFSNPPEFWPLPYGTITGYLTAVADCLESGHGPFAEDPHKVPGLAAGCLLWERPGGTAPASVEWVPVR